MLNYSLCTRNINSASWRFVIINGHDSIFPIIFLYQAFFRFSCGITDVSSASVITYQDESLLLNIFDVEQYSGSSCIIIVDSWAFVIIAQHDTSSHTIDRYQASFPLLSQNYGCPPDHSSSLNGMSHPSPSPLNVKHYSWCPRNIIHASWQFVIIADHHSSFPIIGIYHEIFLLLLRHHGCFLSIRPYLPGWFTVPKKKATVSKSIPDLPASLLSVPELSSSLTSMNHRTTPSIDIRHHSRCSCSITAASWASTINEEHDSSFPIIARCQALFLRPRKITASYWQYVIIDDHDSLFPNMFLYQALFPLFLGHYIYFLSIRHPLPGWIDVPKNSSISRSVPPPPSLLLLFPKLS